ncbi:hypothetical protein BCP78_0062 [Bacillus phage BCP78]|uniref:Uncharacterized protein n=3 Tax=Tsarbombavirus BCP78 TaxID=1985182 RepID=J9PQM0_9CAUD|nr:hypothetical protein BCP78_0062 [Bacillus phage BCP78]YP_009783425.1 hypothetical protein QLX27_gp052 [Bacillus phage BCU4]AEW47069.1 hypothetical protein BCP78_0062 [Bacillus phage BCP78]AEW47558.1 hypothetical protein BCU4_0052 [Bacillus phage BCU4]AQN32436.1 hypothetical protein BCP12_013 [Bacillus phage BCP12]
MSRRVRRRAISKCKGADLDTRDYWRKEVMHGKTNQTHTYMIGFLEWAHKMKNIGKRLAEAKTGLKVVKGARPTQMTCIHESGKTTSVPFAPIADFYCTAVEEGLLKPKGEEQ